MHSTKETRGGARINAGRKKGSSVYGETTTAVRIPESLVPTVKNLLDARKRQLEILADHSTAILLPAKAPTQISLPLFISKVPAGFPSPADDYVEKTLDLNELCVKQPAATFFVRVEGESMLGAGIHPNDILVVDRSIVPVPGKIVVCALNGELTVKRLDCENDQWKLKAENPNYPDIELHEEIDMVVWGVVTNVIHAV
jgi:DNA polymerase V